MNAHVRPYQVIDLTPGHRMMINMLDHDVIDGAPAARFIHRLVELIASGHGLSEADEE